MGTHQLAAFSDKKHVPPQYEKYLHLMLAIANHPSLLMTSFALPFWLLLFRDESLSRLPLFAPVVPEVLKTCGVKLMKVGDMQPPSAALARYVRCVNFKNITSYYICVRVCKMCECVSEWGVKFINITSYYVFHMYWK